jgi:hypothetical protein
MSRDLARDMVRACLRVPLIDERSRWFCAVVLIHFAISIS